MATVSIFLQYVDRIDTLKSILQRVESQHENEQSGKEVNVETELWSGERKLNFIRKNDSIEEEGEAVSTVRELSTDVMRIMRGEETQLGGRALIRLNQK